MNSLEFQAAFTVFDKHKRKNNLSKEDLHLLGEEALKFSEERKQNGKTPNLDYLIQKLGEKFKPKDWIATQWRDFCRNFGAIRINTG